MGLEKAILYKKEKRKAYRKSKVFDRSCRNHGSCSWCRRNRMYKNIKRIKETEEKRNDIFFTIKYLKS